MALSTSRLISTTLLTLGSSCRNSFIGTGVSRDLALNSVMNDTTPKPGETASETLDPRSLSDAYKEP